MGIEKIMVVGAGQMGSGIALTAAGSGLGVVLHDLRRDSAERGRAVIERLLAARVEKEKMTLQQMEAALGRIVISTALEEAAEVDFVIEAATENLEIKRQIFHALDRAAAPEAILATNTSSLSITEIAAATARPAKVVGMHFMNPVPVMALVEVVRGMETSDATTQSVVELARRLGKTPVTVNDSPGFVSNRVLMPMINEAICCVQEGVAEPQAVDEVMKLGMNHPIGPLALADLIGLDTCLAVMEVLHRDFGDSKYRPSPLLRRMVQAGRLGRKSGRGFYDYPAGS